ncbi:hypothetical protein [Erythrobacter sp. Alg231-14]|uniref:hypothetical protein n=1 Tax=Erythrobacter sp. Alg231-14 TaxID=1922225 RepID=UPI000D552B5F
MKIGIASTLVLVSAVSGCSSDVESSGNGDQSVDATLVASLVDRFDVPACADASLRYSGRQESPDGMFVQRIYDAPVDCRDGLIAMFATVNFTEQGPNSYAGEISDGSKERIEFEFNNGSSAGTIRWEVDVE